MNTFGISWCSCLTLSRDYVVRRYKYVPGLHNNAPILYFVVCIIILYTRSPVKLCIRRSSRRVQKNVGCHVIFVGDHDRGIMSACRVPNGQLWTILNRMRIWSIYDLQYYHHMYLYNGVIVVKGAFPTDILPERPARYRFVFHHKHF